MNAVRPLQARQAALQAWLLRGEAGIAGDLDGGSVQGETVGDRLRLYADAYRLRLADVLGQDYPATKALLGEARFDALADAYLHAHPSKRPSVRHFGEAFADWLSARRELPRSLHELARFEWTQGLVFDAADAATLDLESLAALPADAWPSLRLQLHPSARLLSLACNAPALADAAAHGRPLPRLRVAAAAQWLLWRRDGDVHWRRLDADEAAALHGVLAGDAFAALCARLNQPPGDGGALRAASLLKRWLADGVLANHDIHPLAD